MPFLKAIVFLKVARGSMGEIVDFLGKIPEITRITSITGEYDLVVEVEVDDPERLHQIFTDQIDLADGVEETLTHVVMKEFVKT
ncbi:MAG: Lrp/AsnC family transcriptional regulator [Promethearchaeota archaeon]